MSADRFLLSRLVVGDTCYQRLKRAATRGSGGSRAFFNKLLADFDSARGQFGSGVGPAVCRRAGLRPAVSRAKTSRQDSRLADMYVGPTWLGAKRMTRPVH